MISTDIRELLMSRAEICHMSSKEFIKFLMAILLKMDGKKVNPNKPGSALLVKT